jgi:hypothetical protein
MSGMADEMARRLEADGGSGLPGGDGAGVAPGADGGSPPAPAPPAAGPSTTDTGADGRTPDTIPYARFKEVNDGYARLRDLEPLVEYGYDSDSLGQLAAFHQAYSADPVGTWAGMADNLDLPQELKDQIKAHLTSDAGSQPGPSAGTPSAQTPTPAPELPDEVKRRLEYVDRLQAREAEAERNAMLDRVMATWDTLEANDGIPAEQRTSEAMKLNMIAAMGASGRQFATVEELAKAGYDTVSGHNASVLGGAVRTGRTGAPLSVPGGAPAPAAPINFGGDIRAATKAAEAAIARGELPSLKQ